MLHTIAPPQLLLVLVVCITLHETIESSRAERWMHMLCFILLNDKWLFLTKECSAVIQNKRPPKLAELAFYLKADMYRLSLSLLNVPTRPSGLYYRRIFFLTSLILFLAAYIPEFSLPERSHITSWIFSLLIRFNFSLSAVHGEMQHKIQIFFLGTNGLNKRPEISLKCMKLTKFSP